MRGGEERRGEGRGGEGRRGEGDNSERQNSYSCRYLLMLLLYPAVVLVFIPAQPSRNKIFKNQRKEKSDRTRLPHSS